MARLKYSPTKPDSGFRPIEVSRAEISRMREETNRVVQNMENNRVTQLNQGRQYLQQLQQDAEYTRRANARNAEIEQKNIKTDLLQSQLDAETTQRQAEVTTKAAEQIFGSLATFSQTAADLSQKRAVEEEKRKANEGVIAATLNPDIVKSVNFQNLEAVTLQSGEILAGNINIQEAQGADSNSIAKARAANPTNSYLTNKGNASYVIATQAPIIKERIINSGMEFEWNGQKVTAAAAERNPELMEAINTLAIRIAVQNNNLLGLEDRFLAPGLEKAQAALMPSVIQAAKLQRQDLNAQTVDQQIGIVNNNPDGMKLYGSYAFRRIAEIEGYSKAHDAVNDLGQAMTPDGQFLHSLSDIANLDLYGNGSRYADVHKGRFIELEAARNKKEQDFQRNELANDELAYKADAQRILGGLRDDPTQANADTAVKWFMDNHGRVPPEILTFQSSYTTTAREKTEAIKKLEAIPDGLITLEAVAAAQGLDPNAGRVMAQRYEAQEARYNRGVYKDTAEAFKTTANGVTSFGTNKPNTPSSIFLQERMKAEYRKRVDQAVAGGMDFNQAATTIGQALDAEVKAGARDPNSQWFRKPDAPGGAAQFPNLTKGNLSRLEQANRRFQELKKNIQTNGIETVIGTKGSIITAEEAPVIARNYGKPGFTVPQDVLAVAGMSNGLDPMVIINRQFQALGLPLLQPPPSLQTTGQTVSPSFQRLLYKTPSVQRSTRALGSANMFNPAIVPNNLGMLYQQAGQATGVNPAFLAALGEIESTHKADNVSYNGSSFGVMQINRASHPNFFAQNDWKNPQANINYGAQYYSDLLKKYGDPVAAAMAYNAGPGNYDAYLRGEMPDGPKKTEMLNHGKKFTKALYKYGGSSASLNTPHIMRSGNGTMRLTSSAANYIGMDTSDGPDVGRNACVWALNKVMRAAGMDVPWGNSLYVPFVKGVLDQRARRVNGPMPGAIAIMQDNHPTDPYPHIGIVGADGMIISNSSSRARFDWKGTPQEYEQKYGRPNLYYMLN